MLVAQQHRDWPDHVSFVLYHTVWGVEPVLTHQTSWLESTGVCGVRQHQAGGNSARKGA